MKLFQKSKIVLTYVACLVLTLSVPLSAFATEPISAETTTVVQQAEPESAAPVSPEPAAPKPPTAPAPAAPKAPEPAKPKQPKETYTYDAVTKKWNSNKWQWDAAAGKYVKVVTVVDAPVQENGTQDKGGATASSSSNTTSIANALDSVAVSGNASVKGNTKGGSATSGDSSASATIVNNVNSSMSNSNNKETANFVMDIMGDVNGDIMLEPLLLKAMLEANAAKNGNTDTQIKNNTSIQNDLNLSSASGDATVAGNTSAGNATTGSANSVANVMNMVNSMVAANQSFNGTINIYGNLNGDILIAPDFLAQMLASNGIQANAAGATKLNSKDTQEIVNNVSLAAESGAALVGNNTSAGNAKTGDAETNLVIFNMTGHQIVASNSLLVFVNVLGSWVGVIVDAPQGTTAAAIGNNVTKNEVNPSMVVDATNDTKIVNNINLNAQSGDATVRGNTQAGNATTGNATASANIANISNSNMGLTGWFGQLFINVFGTWNGSLGVDTAAGNPIQQQSESQSSSSNQVIRFIPREQRKDRSAVQRLTIIDTSTQSQAAESTKPATATKASAESVKSATDTKSDIPTQQSYIDGRKQLNVPLTVASLVLIVGSGYALRKYLF